MRPTNACCPKGIKSHSLLRLRRNLMLKVIAQIWAVFSGKCRALKASYRFCPAREFLLIKTQRPYTDEKSIRAAIAPLFARIPSSLRYIRGVAEFRDLINSRILLDGS